MPSKTDKKAEMNLKDVEKLIKIVEKSNIQTIVVEENGVKIEIKKDNYQSVVAPPVQSATVVQLPQVIDAVQAPVPAAEVAVAKPKGPSIDSPMVGTFYGAPSPDTPNFVKVGDHVSKGDVVCIVEAMKMFNEIESEHSGVITQILVSNEAPVELDQPLMIVSLNE
jgi:acetyl-CoA carboxylase biotin carboxyl carrier protein